MMPGKDGWKSARRAERLARRIGRQYLTGLGSEVQGAVLGDLVAMWLAGHTSLVALDEEERRELEAARRELFEIWAETMWRLVTINENIMREQYGLPPVIQKEAS